MRAYGRIPRPQQIFYEANNRKDFSCAETQVIRSIMNDAALVHKVIREFNVIIVCAYMSESRIIASLILTSTLNVNPWRNGLRISQIIPVTPFYLELSSVLMFRITQSQSLLSHDTEATRLLCHGKESSGKADLSFLSLAKWIHLVELHVVVI